MESYSHTEAERTPSRPTPTSVFKTPRTGVYRVRLTLPYMPWTRKLVKSSGRAVTRSLPGTIGAGSRLQMAVCTLAPMTASFTASAFRSRVLLLLAFVCVANAQDADRIQALERQLRQQEH